MKRFKNLLIVCMCAFMMVLSVMTESVSAFDEEKPTEAVLIKNLNGWVTMPKDQKRYYRNGKYFKGCKKIGKKYYFFNSNGLLQKKNVTVNGILYYIDVDGQVQGQKKGSWYYSPTGKKLSKDKANELRAYQNARRVVSAITSSKMSKEEKLKVCFEWMKYNDYRSWRKLSSGGESWYAVNANDLLERRSGDCISYACALAYMAKVIGYEDVNVCSRGTRKDNLHTWTEINGLVYDSYFAKQGRGNGKYYGISYDEYKFETVLRKKIPEKNSWLS